ncbi:tocopherol cyclase family protein [Alkaliphilus sp. MSJ-5]|uniref:Tocopherol cyclase family protein n=1 Tax=Alkaliphilus flagellatus TaxID=2841507 RepID=A0ABS6G0B3_9FIRM|nr:tocopherol cyclase family protein [Alkaliphilus flagellatus]MBU5675923.1 tocopherol cyclase family protein [Alkaliphilus flagellatus]
MYLFRKLWNPEMFQGQYKRKNYFEGWYYKLIDSPKKNVWAIIPGVAYGKCQDDRHAFVQVIEANSCKVHYFKYDINSFKFNNKDFHVQIENNHFYRNGIMLDLRDENSLIKGELSFNNIVPFPKKFFNPGIMGPFSFIPFMECYHGIVNIHHEIEGRIFENNTEIDFTSGYGYIEKDWGKSFPEAWIWLQSNHFLQDNVSVMFSIAKIPWFRSHFTGFLSFLRIDNEILMFATYTGAKIKKLKYKNNILDVSISSPKYILEMKAKFSKGGVLKAPKNGMMDRDISESITSAVKVKLYDSKSKKVVFSGEGLNTGFEVVGDVEQFYFN